MQTGKKMAVGVAMLALLSGAFAMLVLAAKQPAGSSADRAVRVVDSKSAAVKTPTGVQWPSGLDYEFQEPEKVAVGEQFKATITIAPALFDLENIEVEPSLGGSMKLVEGGAAWKGNLKKGEKKQFAFTLKATASDEGYLGSYGIFVKVPDYYTKLRAYIEAQQEGEYANPAAKEDIQRQIEIWEKDLPVYEQGLSSGFELPQAEVK